MSIVYEAMSYTDAAEKELDPPWGEDWEIALEEDYDGYRWGIWEINLTDNTSKFLMADGGEPEDNCFYRDGAWIAPALNDAYKRGYADGVLGG